MAAGVTDGSDIGTDAILERWRLLSLCFKDVDVLLERLVYIAENREQAVDDQVLIAANLEEHADGRDDN
ncbi:hypothetical protein GN958_ATG08536 [Phytophthora infestans]|uniref:Uncharacterized protein n=1 Tax=Phytophthora infestans TaxID=4787 RepID=A0A8S9UNS9_PHYIN|nr:hypothetical protein GN958_ATG08536 [Phytophthora infestans]